ncbi:tyrosine-protein phosphatase non-receptor type substrate 1-like [Scyliorhinus canicula]|uniref:tyrosine-protein phosphatase non-receptor type substrate 1-like n=1 Tax=Scyliorhinus canicula TaxID=7830 RepID=UPI0018F33EFA|nr:tyrosine-protein phosphatase non-receptor type substrate 1-like [Scyliorhinus canicula]
MGVVSRDQFQGTKKTPASQDPQQDSLTHVELMYHATPLSMESADRVSFSVSQAPEEVTISRGGNVTFYCIFPIFKEQSWVRILWWKHGENEYLRSSADRRKRFGQEGKVSGFFQLLGATLGDAGIYHCSVIRHGLLGRNGTGSHLIVHVAPTPLKLVSKTSEWDSSVPLILVCETAAFSPENFTLTWYKNGVKAASGIITRTVQNSEGLYEVCSSLSEMRPVLSDASYTCSVSHVSLKTPAIATLNTSDSKQDYVGMSRYYSGFRYTVGGLAFLLLLIIAGARYKSR